MVGRFQKSSCSALAHKMAIGGDGLVMGCLSFVSPYPGCGSRLVFYSVEFYHSVVVIGGIGIYQRGNECSE